MISLSVIETLQFWTMVAFLLAWLAIPVLALLHHFFDIGKEPYETFGRYWLKPIPIIACIAVFYTFLGVITLIYQKY